ncbi:MAG: putative Type pilus assembly PilZ [Klenkia sp.]|nr:putative Type pilus assembly PilZ [Klenkia sp.]
MTLASTIGRDRPGDGARVTVLHEDVLHATRVGQSTELDLTVAVARTRDARRVRLGLGAGLLLSWSADGSVRSRHYRVDDVQGGVDPQWLLRPLAPAGTGDRRLAPRAVIAVPVAVQGLDGLVVGTSVDLSVSGARISFPESTQRRGLPGAGGPTRVVLVVDDVRLELDAHVVDLATRPGGVRELRVAYLGLDQATVATLRTTVDRLLGLPLS